MPGLIDVHIHLRGVTDAKGPQGRPIVDETAARAALASYLYSGVTTVVDVGNQPENILKMRADERAGRIASPRIFATGNLITYPGSHGDYMAVRIADFEKDKALLERHLAEQQPDILKITYDEEGWGALARAHNRRSSAAPSPLTLARKYLAAKQSGAQQ